MATVHLLTQYIWPDAAPTGLYAEQLAARIEQDGHDVRLVGGRGGYRTLPRPQPVDGIIHLDHYKGRRGNLSQTFAEYASVTRAFRDYIERFVRPMTTCDRDERPAQHGHAGLRDPSLAGRGIYWLQDYYPELVRGLHEYPAPFRHVFRRLLGSIIWRAGTSRENRRQPWRSGAKFGRDPQLADARLRQARVAPEPRTAIYSGNLGFGHDVGLLIAACEELRTKGYRITMRSDGRGAALLPRWLKPEPLEDDPARLRDDLLRHEVHLIAANPKITQAIFPSKIWNSIAARRRLVCTGFAGEMAIELEAAQRATFAQHLEQWADLVLQGQGCSEPAGVPHLETALA